MGLRGLAGAVAVVACLVPASAALGDPGPALTVDANASRHAISPYIYGWNFANEHLGDLAAQLDLPLDRRGGNAADTLNWQTGVENHSNDFFFENIPTCWDTCPNGWDPARSYTDQIDFDQTAHAKTLLDIPMLGYVPKDEGAADFQQPLPCAYPKSVFGNQNLFDDYQVQAALDPCGNGQLGNPAAWITNNPVLGHATADAPANEAPWIDALKQKYGDASQGGVKFYETGNEPGLWDSTHHDWHPQPTTAQELWDDMRGTALMVKQEDPTAQVIGPAEWGWPNYFCSPADGGCGPGGPAAPGANSDWTLIQGGIPVLPWLLKQFKDYADAHANLPRLLDYVDIHYYRQESSTGIQATRSLWDPAYTDQSWINDTIDLIPRMKQWVNAYYPGTKLSLSEYDLAVDSHGDNTHIDLDNLIEADVLGIFGREGLDMATLWPETDDMGHYTSAFKLFRDYDGNKSKFGDTSVGSTSADQSKLAVYGAERSSDGALTLVIINKSSSDLTSSLSLSNFTPATSAQVWRFSNVGSGIQKQTDQPVDPTGFSATFPALSMTMVVIPPSSGATAPPPTTGDTQTPPVDSSQQQPPPPPTSTTTTTPTPTPTSVRCTAPKLLGLTLKQAKVKLRKAHCALGKVTKKRSPKRKGRVIAQKPKPRTTGRAGLKVAVVLSRGR